MQVAGRDKVEFVHADINRAQCLFPGQSSWATVLIHPGVSSHAGVEQEGALRMNDHITQAGFR